MSARFTKYIKVTFFRGLSLRPVLPGKSKYEDVRYFDIYEGKLDEAQLADWVEQASLGPGRAIVPLGRCDGLLRRSLHPG